MALSIGLKVDAEALPSSLVKQLKKAKWILVIRLLRGFIEKRYVVVLKIFNSGSFLCRDSCALCHSTVDDSLAPGIGRRLDGWAIGI